MSDYDDETINQWSSYETKTKEQQAQVQASKSHREVGGSSSSFNVTTYRTYPHIFFNTYSAIACITSVALAVAQFIGFTINNLPKDINHGLRFLLGIYLVAMCVVAMLTELEWLPFIKQSKILTFWITRGLIYIFMSLLSLNQLIEDESGKSDNQILFIKGCTYTFAIIGAGYTLMGALCLQIVLGRVRKEYSERRSGGKSNKINNDNDIPEAMTDLDYDLDGVDIS